MSKLTRNSRAIAAFTLFSSTLASAAVLRVATYNITSSGGAPRAGLDTILQAIGNESVNGRTEQLDLLTIQEVQSQATTAQAVVNLLNADYGANTYAHGSLNGASTGSGTQGVIYNTATLQLISEKAIGTASTSGQPRQTLRYEFRPVGGTAANDFYVYTGHFKASDDSTSASRRQVEAAAIRADADSLPADARILYTGDFNLYRSSDPTFSTLTAPGNGQAVDPINRVGSWHDNAAFTSIFTQAPANNPASGLTGGGLDDRFDFQLTSSDVLTPLPGELTYLAGSYHTFGNNGSVPLNSDINSLSNTALAGLANRTTVLNLLTTVSDHLPVVADYEISVPEPTCIALLLVLPMAIARRPRQHRK